MAYVQRIWVSFGPPLTYNGVVAMERARTVMEWADRMQAAAPPTDDDVTVLLDGRRLDSRKSIELWLAEVTIIRDLEGPTHRSVV